MNAQQEISDLNFLVDCLYEGSDLDSNGHRAGLVGEVGSALQLLSSDLLQEKIREGGGTFKMCSTREVQGYRRLTRYFDRAYEAVKNAHGNSNISKYFERLEEVKSILEMIEFENYVVEFYDSEVYRLEDDVDSQRERVSRLASNACGADGGPRACEKLEKAAENLKDSYRDLDKARRRLDEVKVWDDRYETDEDE